MSDRTPGTKIAESLWTSPGGATMAEVAAATGGPKYNHLRQLRARGYRIDVVKEGRETRYFATPPGRPSYEATSTSKGQLTIPREVRERLRLRPGGTVRFTIEDAGAVMTPASRRLGDLVGVLPKPKRSATTEELEEAIRKAALGRYLRSTRAGE